MAPIVLVATYNQERQVLAGQLAIDCAGVAGTAVDVVSVEVSTESELDIALLAQGNVYNRANVGAVKKVQAVERLLASGYAQKDIAAMVGLSEARISQITAVGRLCGSFPELYEAFATGRVSFRLALDTARSVASHSEHMDTYRAVLDQHRDESAKDLRDALCSLNTLNSEFGKASKLCDSCPFNQKTHPKREPRQRSRQLRLLKTA